MPSQNRGSRNLRHIAAIMIRLLLLVALFGCIGVSRAEQSPVGGNPAAPRAPETNSPDAGAKEGAAAPPQERRQGPRFDILEFEVHGNSLLGVEAVERAVYPFLGEGRSFDDVQAARTALEAAYRDAGYPTVLVDIPEQGTASAVIELRVTEATVGRLRVTGSRYFDQTRILGRVTALAEGQVPFFPAVQEQLAGVNRTADRRVTPLLRPGREPGTIEAELKIDDKPPFHGGVEVNDRYGTSRAPNPSKVRMTANLRFDNWWQLDHSFSFQYLLAPQNRDEANVFSASYVLPMGSGEDMLAIYGVRSDSNSDLSSSLPGTDVLGRGDIVGLRGIFPLKTLGKFSHSVTLGLDFKRFQEQLLQQEAGAIETPITYWLLSAQYGGSIDHFDGETSFGATVGLSLRGLRSNESEFEQKRFLGQSNFATLRWNVQRVQRLAWGFSLTARAEGQAASQPLVSSEQFAAGGADSVRGYPEAVQVGDAGARWSVEARSPSLFGGPDSLINEFRLLGFWEGARLRVMQPLPGQISGFSLASVGGGMRMRALKGLSVSLDRARRLKDAGALDTHGSLEKDGYRWHFSAGYQF